MRILKGVIVVIGVGVLVVVFGFLVVWFKNFEKGVKLFSVIGYIFDGLMVIFFKKIE